MSGDGYVVLLVENTEEWIKPFDVDGKTLNELYLEEDKNAKATLSYDDTQGTVLIIPAIHKPIKLLGVFEQHPIDVSLQMCININTTTMGMNDCYAKAYQS
ncbi:hypothetical protein [Vibrio superstes]|uniref:Uncharacterized protein n=1 Tax=Vibrio superstes NBRC 103154 TaxID=1219062 RepID=A0A511QMG2_9VIBR|nr:hypothetical protein [Vibrio superstes]GEM78513.1 hypothetical protein VSU01S_07580 [Vibrio superstes NBRC 103154]